MNQLELAHLHSFCAKHELDVMLIDSSLTYKEAKNELLKHIPEEPEEQFEPELCEKVEVENEEAWIKEYLGSIPISKELSASESYQELCDEVGYDEKEAERINQRESATQENELIRQIINHELEEERPKIIKKELVKETLDIKRIFHEFNQIWNRNKEIPESRKEPLR